MTMMTKGLGMSTLGSVGNPFCWLSAAMTGGPAMVDGALRLA